jgi:hypothetical protein
VGLKPPQLCRRDAIARLKAQAGAILKDSFGVLAGLRVGTGEIKPEVRVFRRIGNLLCKMVTRLGEPLQRLKLPHGSL